MTSAKTKILSLTLALLLLSGPSFAEGYMGVRMGARVQFIYVQIVRIFDGHFLVPTDVTKRVNYELKDIGNNEKILIID